jgi:hypothetical protein
VGPVGRTVRICVIFVKFSTAGRIQKQAVLSVIPAVKSSCVTRVGDRCVHKFDRSP